ncbi:hypothetical protein [Pseudonocardia adelaidensis]|uniref:Uncharacterized protein n=1 Tax=Pseudonocardia adelaidensis TaxID=648754 RepID=A0ABP9NB72_9PSEU
MGDRDERAGRADAVSRDPDVDDVHCAGDDGARALSAGEWGEIVRLAQDRPELAHALADLLSACGAAPPELWRKRRGGRSR